MVAIDLRSDTVTLPTPAMRQAMFQAEVGDDVLGEDPTVARLEAMAAQRMGQEAALFNPSGTMSNLVAVLGHCGRGEEVILGDEAHMVHHELGGLAALGGAMPHPIPSDAQGRLDPHDVEKAIRPRDNPHFPRTGLIALENTHNRCGGTVLTLEDMAAVAQVAGRYGIPIHLDGARIFNAAVYLGVEPAELARGVSTVSFCLSKGLSAPVGSLLCGSREFIARARRYRRMLGGGMRQAGVLAAAGIVALQTMVERLWEDHLHARLLAEGLAGISGLSVDPSRVQTNIVMVRVPRGTAPQIQAQWARAGVKASSPDASRLRLVTHYGIGRGDIEEAIRRIRQGMGG